MLDFLIGSLSSFIWGVIVTSTLIMIFVITSQVKDSIKRGKYNDK